MRVNLWGESGREAALLFYVCGSVVRLLLIARYGGVAGAMQGSGILVRKTHRANSNDCLPCVFIDNTIKNWSRYFINWRVAGLCLRLSRRLNTLLRGRFACLWSAFVRLCLCSSALLLCFCHYARFASLFCLPLCPSCATDYAYLNVASSDTVSFLRPFARRAANTLRPLAVAILARNPCLLILLRRDGWNVLFIAITISFLLFLQFPYHCISPVDWVLCGVQRYNDFLILQSICRNFSRF